ncbi:MAG: hypothetical protein ACREB9_07810 [Thermoplasmata archaeon]
MTDRPPTHVSVYLTPETYRRLHVAAERDKRKLTAQAEYYIERGLDGDGK